VSSSSVLYLLRQGSRCQLMRTRNKKTRVTSEKTDEKNDVFLARASKTIKVHSSSGGFVRKGGAVHVRGLAEQTVAALLYIQ
jgi:hypothetical protein